MIFFGKAVEIWMWTRDLESHPERESDESDVFVSAYGTVSLII